MNMVRARLYLYDLYPFLLAQFPQYYPHILFDLSIYLHSPILR